jgi:hypothetical protein
MQYFETPQVPMCEIVRWMRSIKLKSKGSLAKRGPAIKIKVYGHQDECNIKKSADSVRYFRRKDQKKFEDDFFKILTSELYLMNCFIYLAGIHRKITSYPKRLKFKSKGYLVQYFRISLVPMCKIARYMQFI